LPSLLKKKIIEKLQVETNNPEAELLPGLQLLGPIREK
jgi:hypothetical protein